MKFYSIIIKYRLYIGLALIAIGVLTNIYAGFWPAFLPYLVGLVLIAGHFFFGPLRLIQEHMEAGDMEGAVVETSTVPALDAAVIDAARQRFLGQQTQIPPMYSAIKRDGQPLYKLARAGVEVERAAREIEVFELMVLGFSADRIELETVCSKGTYIRVLSEDIAKALGTCGHVTALRRVHVEPFGAEPMETLESVVQAREQGTWPRVLPADWPLGHLPKVELDGQQVGRIMHGQPVFIVPALPETPATAQTLEQAAAYAASDLLRAGLAAARVRLYDATGRFLGIGEADGTGTVKPRRLFSAES